MTSTSGRTAPQPQRNSQHHTVYTIYMCTVYKTVFPLCTEYFLIQYKRDSVGVCAVERGAVDRIDPANSPHQHNNNTTTRQYDGNINEHTSTTNNTTRHQSDTKQRRHTTHNVDDTNCGVKTTFVNVQVMVMTRRKAENQHAKTTPQMHPQR